MERTPLASKAVVSAAYDAANHTLELEFMSGRIYQYEGVPRGAYEWLLRTPSKGAYVSRMINGQYSFRDVTPATEVLDLELQLRNSFLKRGPHSDPQD